VRTNPQTNVPQDERASCPEPVSKLEAIIRVQDVMTDAVKTIAPTAH
jgi:hypothetical protein